MSAALLGCYDSFKKHALRENAVIPVLFLNTLFSSLIFLPFIVLSGSSTVLDGTVFHVASGGWELHRYILLKALIVLSSWILGYFGSFFIFTFVAIYLDQNLTRKKDVHNHGK